MAFVFTTGVRAPMSDSVIDPSVDTSWCPVCDRAIAPLRVQVPIPHPAPAPNTKSQKPSLQGGGLVNGTGRGLRRPLTVQKDIPPPVKMRTVICQDTPYYCSEECRVRDLEDELYQVRLAQRSPYSAFPEDFDEPAPLRVPQNTPAQDNYFQTPPSPHFISSGTESDSSSVSTSRSRLDDSTSYSPASVLRNLPPLTARKPSKKHDTPPPSQYGVMMAAQRIKAAFDNPLLPRSNANSPPRKGEVVLPGWTDGDRTQWRSSVYGGVEIIPNPAYRPPTSSDAYTGGSYSAQGARRAAGLEEEFASRRHALAVGQSAPQPSTRTLHDNFAGAFKRNNSSSQLSTDDERGSPTEASIHPLLSNSLKLKGKILVPQLRSGPPSRCGSSTSLTSSVRRENVNVGSPLAQHVAPRPATKEKGARSWSYDDQPLFELPPRTARKTKQVKEVWVPSPGNKSGIEGTGEGKWQKTQVEVEALQPRKRLFLFGA